MLTKGAPREILQAARGDVHGLARSAAIIAGVGLAGAGYVTGRIEPLGTGSAMFASVFRSLLPVALAHGITTEEAAAATLAAFGDDADRFADSSMTWPLMIGAWKRKELA